MGWEVVGNEVETRAGQTCCSQGSRLGPEGPGEQ